MNAAEIIEALEEFKGWPDLFDLEWNIQYVDTCIDDIMDDLMSMATELDEELTALQETFPEWSTAFTELKSTMDKRIKDMVDLIKKAGENCRDLTRDIPEKGDHDFDIESLQKQIELEWIHAQILYWKNPDATIT